MGTGTGTGYVALTISGAEKLNRAAARDSDSGKTAHAHAPGVRYPASYYLRCAGARTQPMQTFTGQHACEIACPKLPASIRAVVRLDKSRWACVACIAHTA